MRIDELRCDHANREFTCAIGRVVSLDHRWRCAGVENGGDAEAVGQRGPAPESFAILGFSRFRQVVVNAFEGHAS